MRPHERRKALGLPSIRTERFINEAVSPSLERAFMAQHSFETLPIDERLKRAIAAKGYLSPTPIQDGAIPPALEGRDLIGVANTGTGKTAAFLIPIINALLRGRPGPALVVAPTRELATQINGEFRLFAQGLRLYSVLCVGGVGEGGQIQALRRRPQLVVGTPGRLRDFLERGVLRIETCPIFVLDEADRMVDMGFIRDIRYIITKLPERRQSLFFSATIPTEVEGLIKSLLHDPVTIRAVARETAEGVDQDVIRAGSKEEKQAILVGLLSQPEFDRVLVFGRTKWGVQKLSDALVESGVQAVAIHGNKNQSQRDRSLRAFKEGKVQVLVATDVAARGLHIEDVSHVINFDLPNTYEDYVHRIGRTGRVDKLGKALTFVPKQA